MSDQLRIPLLFPEADTLTPDFLQGLNAEQQDAATAPANQALQVLAGAGTGKTELIARRFIKLCRDFRAEGIEDAESRILVVTFTSDAAEGMRMRIRQRLWDDNGIDPAETSPDFGQWISTFHQFCMRILRTHAPVADLPPDFAVLNTLEQQILFNRLHEDVLAGRYPDLTALCQKYHLPFNPDVLSLDALRTIGLDDPEAVLDAGSIYRLINQIKTTGLSPAEFLAQTLSCSHRLAERLKVLPMPHLPELKPLENLQLKLEAWRETLSPWGADNWDPVADAERKAESAGRKPTPAVYKNELPELCRFFLETKTYAPLSVDAAFLDRFSAAEERLIAVLAAIYALYQDKLLDSGMCDFDDLINRTTALLSRFPAIQAQYRQQFRAIIVDEFQDSNAAQLRLLELLTGNHAENLTVVGDIKQSIYGFRFAQPENLELIFRNADCKQTYLRTNYRSAPPILDVANRLTERMTGNARQSLHPPDSETGMQSRGFPPVTWVNLDGMTEKNGKPAHPPIAEKRELEARYIATEIDRLTRSGAHDYSDIAVLVRSHARAESIQEALAALDIPSVRQKDLGFFRQTVIKDAMALMRLLRRSGDDFPLVRVLQRKLNQRQLDELMRLRRDMARQEGGEAVSLLTVCLDLAEKNSALPGFPPEVAEAVADLARRLVTLRRQRTRLRPAGLFSALADVVGLIDPDTPEWRQKQQRLALRTFENLLNALSRGRTVQPTLEEVLDLLEQYAANPEQPLPVAQEMTGENAVRIMTVFAAKGLEFPVVFAACVERARAAGIFESTLIFDPQYDGKAGFGLILGKLNGESSLKKAIRRRCWRIPRAAEEAQRIFYVALTRAKERLYVIRCPQSEAWTDPAGYPTDCIQALSEEDIAESVIYRDC